MSNFLTNLFEYINILYLFYKSSQTCDTETQNDTYFEIEGVGESWESKSCRLGNRQQAGWAGFYATRKAAGQAGFTGGERVLTRRLVVSGTDYIAAMVLPFTRPPPPSAILLSSAARGSHIAIAPGWNPGTYTWLLGGNRRCGLAKPDWTPGSRPRNARSFFLLLPHSPFVAGGDGGGGGLGPVPRRRTLQQLLPSAQSDPPPHLALPVCCCEKTLCIFALVYSLAVFLTNCYQVNSWFVPFQIHNESSCSSPADGTPRSPADYTCTSPDEESSTFHSSTCRLGTSRSSPGGLSGRSLSSSILCLQGAVCGGAVCRAVISSVFLDQSFSLQDSTKV